MADPKNKLKKTQYHQYPPIEISADDFVEIIFSDVEGYVIGTDGNPVSATSISVNFTGAKPGTEVLLFHNAESKPVFDAGDTVVIFREIGSYISSVVNPISILFIGSNKLMIVHGNDAAGIQDGVDFTSAGIITFDSPTQIDYSGFFWRKAGVINSSGTVNDATVAGAPTTWNRIDILEGGSANDAYYKAGIESEDQPFPAITAGRVLLASILRNTDGSNDIEIIPPSTSDFLSKSELSNQTLQSPLTIVANAGDLPNYTTFDLNGKLLRTRPDQSGIFTTAQGIGGFSRILRITLNLPDQVNYYAVIQLDGISATYEKGFLWVQFQIDPSGDIISNKLKCFGEMSVSKYTLIKVDADHYDLFLAHNEVNSFFKFRPISNFGGSAIYEYFQLPTKVDPLPAGDQYAFTSYTPASSNNIYTTLQGEVGWAKTATLTPNLLEQLQYSIVIDLSYVSDTELFYYGNSVIYLEYLIDGTIDYIVARVNGNVNPEDFILVDLPSGELELYFRHLTILSEMKFKANVLKSEEYIELHDLFEIVASLPAGDQYEFDLIGGVVESVTGNMVDVTDPANVVISSFWGFQAPELPTPSDVTFVGLSANGQWFRTGNIVLYHYLMSWTSATVNVDGQVELTLPSDALPDGETGFYSAGMSDVLAIGFNFDASHTYTGMQAGTTLTMRLCSSGSGVSAIDFINWSQMTGTNGQLRGTIMLALTM